MVNVINFIGSGFSAIINVITNILMFHIKFSLIVFVFIVGAQLVSRRHIIKNFMMLNDIPEEAGSQMKSFKKIPFDGWIATILLSFVPIINVEYAIFCVILGLVPENGKFIRKNREFLRTIKGRKLND